MVDEKGGFNLSRLNETLIFEFDLTEETNVFLENYGNKSKEDLLSFDWEPISF